MRFDAMLLHVVALRLGASQADCAPCLHPACRARGRHAEALRRGAPRDAAINDRDRPRTHVSQDTRN